MIAWQLALLRIPNSIEMIWRANEVREITLIWKILVQYHASENRNVRFMVELHLFDGEEGLKPG
jgi:hypothetical protein